jgi:phosphoenolpyruvate carboxykinase (GTP)
MGATAGAETTAAITGAVGRIRRDPMAMLAFIGYDAGTYFSHWLSMFGRMTHPPKIFMVNWFRKSEDGKYLWPGYGENMRVLKWIIDRAVGRAGAMETPIGHTPRLGDLDLRGIDATADAIEKALRVDRDEWEKELEAHGDWLESLGGTVPEALRLQRQLLVSSLKATS